MESDIALRIDAMNLKNRLCDVETNCRNRLHDLAPPNRGRLNSTHIRGTHVPVEEPRPGRAKKPCKWMFLARGRALPALVPAFGLGEHQDRRFGGKAPWTPGSYVPFATCTADRCNPNEEAPPRARPFRPSRVARRPFIDADAVEQSGRACPFANAQYFAA